MNFIIPKYISICLIIHSCNGDDTIWNNRRTDKDERHVIEISNCLSYETAENHTWSRYMYVFMQAKIMNGSESGFTGLWTIKKNTTLDDVNTGASFSRHLQCVIEPYSLTEGMYIISLHNQQTPGAGSYGDCYLSIGIEVPIVIIMGGTNRSAPASRSLTLSVSNSVHLNSPSRSQLMRFGALWTCEASHPFCDTLTSPATKTQITLLDSMLTDGVEVSVKATKPYGSENVSVVQYIRAGKEYSLLEISCQRNCPPAEPQTLLSGTLVLVIRCLWKCEDIKDEDFTWRVTKGDIKGPEIDYGKSMMFERKGRRLGLKNNTMTPGAYYASVELKGPRTGWAGLDLYYVPDPEVKSCKIEPNTGTSFETKFQLKCDPPKTDKDDLYYISVKDLMGDTAYTGFGDEIDEASFYLPKGDHFVLTVLNGNRSYKTFDLYPNVTDQDSDEVVDDKIYMEYYNGSATLQSVLDLVKLGMDGVVLYRLQMILDRILSISPKDSPWVAAFVLDLEDDILDQMLQAPSALAYSLEKARIFYKRVKDINSNMTDSEQFLNTFSAVMCERFGQSYLPLIEFERFPVRLYDWTVKMVKMLVRCTRTKKSNLSFEEYDKNENSNETDILDEVDENDQNFKENLKQLKVLTYNRLDTTVNGVNMIMKTVTRGYDPVVVSDGNWSVVIRRDLGVKMRNWVSQSNNITWNLTGDFLAESFYDVAMLTFNTDLLWWNENKLFAKTHMISPIITDYSGRTITKLIEPISFSFEMLEDQSGSIEFDQVVYDIPENYRTFSVMEFNRNILIRRVSLGTFTACWVQFHHIPGNDFDVIISAHKMPTYSQFRKNLTVRQNAKNKGQYVLGHINKYDYDIFVYVAFLPNMMSVQATNETTYTVNVSFTTSACYVWKSTTETWEPTCRPSNRFNTTHVNCMCTRLSLINGYFENAQSDQIEINSVDIELLMQVNFVVFLWIVFIYVVYVCCALLILREAKKEIYFLADNCKNDLYAYLLVVRTHRDRGSGTSSNVMIKLLGEKMNSEAHVLNFPDPGMCLLQSNSEDWLVLTTNSHLGPLVAIDLWYDGVGANCSWHCKDILVYDMQTSDQWLFRVRRKFTLKNLCRLCVKAQTNFEDYKRTFCERCTTCDNYHSWYLGHSSESFSYFKRITVNFSTMITTNAVALILYGLPKMAMSDFIETNTTFRFDSSLLYVSFVSSITSFLIHITIVCLFRVSKIQNPKYEEGRLPFAVTVFCWVILIILIVVSTSILLVFGWWIPQMTSYLWLISSFFGMIANIILYENIAILIRNFCCPPLGWAHHIDKKLEDLLDIIEKQRTILYGKFGECLLRPYFKQLYKPLNQKQIRKRRQHAYSRKTVLRQLQDLFFILGFLMLLNTVLNARTDKLMIFYHGEMKEVVEGGVTKTIDFYNVDSVNNFYFYLRDTFLKATQSSHWYATFYLLTDQIMMKDYANSYLGVPRMRQVRLKKNSCQVSERMKFVNASCQPEYSPMHEETMNFESGWLSDAHNIESYLNKDIWKYSPEEQTGSSSITGTLTTYPGGGYVSHFGSTIRENRNMIEILENQGWIDDLTRCVIVEMLSFNVNYNCFSYVRLLLEMSATGYVHPSVFVYPARMMVDPQNVDNIGTFITFSLFLLWLGYMIVRKLLVMCKRGKAAWKDFWFYIDLLIPVLGLCSLLVILLRVGLVKQVVKDSESPKYIDHFYLFKLEDLWIAISALLLILSTVRLWTLLRFAIIFRLVEMTTIFATLPMIHVALCYIILLVAFSVSGFVVFGNEIRGFHSFFDTFNTLLALTFKFYAFDIDRYSVHSLSHIHYWLFSLCMIVMRYYFAAIVLVSYTKARVEHSSDGNTYSLKSYFYEKSDFVSKALMFKFKRMRGGELDDDSYLKAKRVGFKRNTISIDSSDIDIMSAIIKSSIRNKQRAQTKSPLGEQDYELMDKITRLMFKKKVTKVEEKDLFYKETVNDTMRKLVDSKRIKEAERIVNVLLDPKIPPPKVQPDKRLENCSSVVKESLDTLQRCTTILKDLQQRLNEFDV